MIDPHTLLLAVIALDLAAVWLNLVVSRRAHEKWVANRTYRLWVPTI